jgi:tetratricopeptide (TPR) repeat protein
MKIKIIGLLIILTAAAGGYAKNEIQQAQVIPNGFVVNSSGLADDCMSLFINPAGLSRLDRINFLVSTGHSLDLNFVGISGTLPYVGGMGIGIFRLTTALGTTKEGLVIGWGKEILDSLAVGLNFRTAAPTVFGMNYNILFDVGLIIYPNSTWGAFFAGSWIANRLHISAVLQNIGKHTGDDLDEEMNLRLGLSYNIKEIWTKVFFEKNLISTSDFFTLGFEFSPKPLEWITLRFAYDVNWERDDFKIGLSLNGLDFSLDAGYSVNRNDYQVSVTGFFESSKKDIAGEIYDEGMGLYKEALAYDKNNDDSAYFSYKTALTKFKLALFYDPENEKADYQRNIVEDILDGYLSKFIKKAEFAEKGKDYIKALNYYYQASLIENTAEIDARVKDLSTNKTVSQYIDDKTQSAEKNFKKGDLIAAKKDYQDIYVAKPYDKSIDGKIKDLENLLRDKAKVYYDKAYDYYKSKNYKSCIDYLNKALVSYPEFQDAKELKSAANSLYQTAENLKNAYAMYKQGNTMGALAAVNKVLNYNKNNSDAQELQEKIIDSLRADIKANLDKGIVYYNDKKYDKAIAELNKVLVVDKNNSVALDYKNRAESKLEALKKLGGM